MSILDQRSTGHLSDDALAEIWTNETVGAPLADQHLQACADCRVRYAAFRDWLDSLRDEAHAEVDETFPGERLAAQQAQITRRLEALERPARVITFPRFARPVTVEHGGGARRWIVAAAVGGLVVGLGVGQLVDLRQGIQRSPDGFTQVARSAPGTGVRIEPASAVLSDDAFIVQLDSSLSSSSAALFHELDAMTPRVRDDR